MMKKQYRTPKVRVGTVKKSIEVVDFTAGQDCDEGQYLPPVLSVFFPLLLSLCLLLFLRIHTCEFRVLRSQVYALESPIVRSDLHAWPLDGALFSAFMRLDCGSA